MESNFFDEFTKSLATATSRRQALKTIAATTLGGILGLSRIGEAFAKKCKPAGRHCHQGSECCGIMTCDPSTNTCTCPANRCDNVSCLCPSGEFCDSNGVCCPGAQFCANGQCCPDGSVCCNGVSCADLSSDDNNCGACGNVCSGSEICINGTCQCVAPFTQCGNTCVDTASDPNNCGGCGIVCGGTCSGVMCCVPCTNPNNPTCCATEVGQPICCLGYPSVNAVCSTIC
jgi:hypothetical protein